MKPVRPFPKQRWKRVMGGYAFWVVAAMLVAITLLHYLTPQIRLLSPAANAFLNRHAVERILFLVPIASATFAFGQEGGFVTLSLAVLLMLPRTLWLSPSPADAFIETLATVVVGYLVTWMIESQLREKALRQKTVAQLRAINEIAAIVSGSLETVQILNDALEKVLEVMGLEAGLIFFLDQQSQKLLLAAHRGLLEVSKTELSQLKLDQGFYGRIAKSGELKVISDSSQDARLAQASVHQGEWRSQLIVPLTSKGEVQGLLVMASCHSRQFFPDELELVTAIGNQVGVAIENAQLHQDVARQLQIQQQLNQVVERITSELELDAILPKVLQIAEELVGADGGGIALLDREKETICYPYLHNLPQELTDVPIPKGRGVAGEVMNSGRPAIVENYRVYNDAIPAFSQAGLASVLAVPILSGDRLYGALTLASLEETKHFSNEDVTILAGIGRQTGIAIENARLYENLRFYIQKITEAQESERKRIARDLHDETIQMLIAISRRLEALATIPERLPEAAKPHLESLRDLIGDTLKGIRRFLHALRPPTLDHLGLMAALEGLADDLRERDKIDTEIRVTGGARRLMPQEELTLFRVVQEILTNVRRHSGASSTIVQVEFHPARVRISVEDNGCGFDAPERIGDLVSSGKLGLIGMYERARALDGTLMIRSRPGEGTVAIVDVPVQPELAQEAVDR